MKDETVALRTLLKSLGRARSRLNAETFVAVLVLWAASLPGFAPGRGARDRAASSVPPAFAPGPWMLLAAARSGNYADAILDGLTSLEEHFPFVRPLMDREKLAGADVLALRELIDLFSGMAPDSPLALRVVEQCVEREMEKWSEKEAPYPLPEAVARALEGLLHPGEQPVCEPCDGFWSFPAGAPARPGGHGTRSGRAPNGVFAVVRRMNRLASGRALPEQAPETLTDIGERGGETFRYVVANPPFNVSGWYGDASSVERDRRLMYGIPPRSNANFAWLQYVLADLGEGGRAAVILPTSTLIGRNPRESDIREKLVRSGVVEAILTLPSGLFPPSRVPVCVWLLDTARRGKAERGMLFLDAERLEPSLQKPIRREQADLLAQAVSAFREGRAPDHAWSAVATLPDIMARNYLLSPNLYIQTGGEPTFLRRDKPPDFAGCLAQLEKHMGDKALAARLEPWTREREGDGWRKAPLPALYQVHGGLCAPCRDFGMEIPLLDVKTIVRHPFLPKVCASLVRVSEERKEEYAIRRGDVLINRTSESLQELGCGCVALEDSQAVCSGFAKRLRPRYPDLIVPGYAAAYFRSGLYRRQILRNVPLIPVSRASLNNRHLEDIYVYYPSLEHQQRISEAFDALHRLERETDGEFRKFLSQVRASFLERAISHPVAVWETSEKNDEAL